MKSYLTKTGDMFGIEARLKEIDGSYKLYYNTKEKRYEVYSEKHGKEELAFVCPFESLDARLIRFARQTRSERAVKLFEEIEKHNEKIIKEEEKIISDKKAEIKERLKNKYKI